MSRAGFRAGNSSSSRSKRCLFTGAAVVCLAVPLALPLSSANADSLPTLQDPNLAVRVVASGFDRPVAMAFLPDRSAFVLEKYKGKVQHLMPDGTRTEVLDLNVNSNSAFVAERGLLNIALHPQFPATPYVYLYYTASNTGADSEPVSATAVNASRLDRFSWNGSALVFDKNLITLRTKRADPGQPERGGHHGGGLGFGRDGKLYLLDGDTGRRGLLQNLACGPTTTCPGPIVADDQYGGPLPDDSHLTGVILRLNDDGTAPPNNPYWGLGHVVGGEVGANLQKVWAYGIRNGFGLDFDPVSGDLWDAENGEDSFDEINRVDRGFNGGWWRIMGPVSRYDQFRKIETTEYPAEQEPRFGLHDHMAATVQEALAGLVHLPGSHYTDPEFSWKYGVPPAGLGFLEGNGLGEEYANSMFVGAASRTGVGQVLRFRLTTNRKHIASDDPRLADRVADNTMKFDMTESESLVFGENFGIITDLLTDPDGNLDLVDVVSGNIYQVYRR
jgi:glucose/arabinose dehydrogenase